MPMCNDDFAACLAGKHVRVDVYGEIFDQRAVAFLTRNQALRFSRELARLAMQVPEDAVRIPVVKMLRFPK